MSSPFSTAFRRNVSSNKYAFLLGRLTRSLGFTTALYCLLALIAALIGAAFDKTIPTVLHGLISSEALNDILDILATSMLVVATFSLSVMVQAYSTATTTATPRATSLLIEDTTAQHALASFIGAFLFSIVGIIALSSELYNQGGTVVLFAATLLVIVLVIVMLLRWIDELSKLGRVEITIDLVEQAARDALLRRAQDPCLGGQRLHELPQNRVPIRCGQVGYVQHIDVARLQEIAERQDLRVYLGILPGSFCDGAAPVAFTDKPLNEQLTRELVSALVIGDGRTFRQDPRFGVVVLAEIAIRALSPAVNDPGTAIDVIGTSTRLLRQWAQARCNADATAITYDRVWVEPLDDASLFEDLLTPLVRDGAGYVEVCVRLQKTLNALTQYDYAPFGEPARCWSATLVARCRSQLTDKELERVLKHGPAHTV